MERDGRMILERSLFGETITCRAERLDEGIHVLLTGGKSHIGAISTAEPGETAITTVFPGHQEQFISAPWAEKLADHTGGRACVVCGIHYDNATPSQIETILADCSELLEQLLDTQ